MVTKRALVSVFDKSGIVEFTQGLVKTGFNILSTGGTAQILREAGIFTVDVASYTGFPELFDGRVKTLHPKIHGALLYLRGNPEHEKVVLEQEIIPIDLVVVDLYPEEIDIGGVSLIRSAAKNYTAVTVVVEKSDYGLVLEEIRRFGDTRLETRKSLAKKAFEKTALYDADISKRL